MDHMFGPHISGAQCLPLSRRLLSHTQISNMSSTNQEYELDKVEDSVTAVGAWWVVPRGARPLRRAISAGPGRIGFSAAFSNPNGPLILLAT